MSRPAEGWKLVYRRGIYGVRFRFKGKRYEISTRTRDVTGARAIAELIYSEIVGGS